MKASAFLLALFGCLSPLASASTVLITFGTSSTISGYNSISAVSKDNSVQLRDKDGNLSGISFVSSTTWANQNKTAPSGAWTKPSDSALRGDSMWEQQFGEGSYTSGGMGNCTQFDRNSAVNTMTFNGLTVGATYTFSVMLGRFDAAMGGNGSGYLSLDGVDLLSAYNVNTLGNSTAYDTSDPTKVSHGGIAANNSQFYTWTFVAESGSFDFNIAKGGTDYTSFQAMGLTQVVPEPATASLGLLGLAALLMRRKRA